MTSEENEQLHDAYERLLGMAAAGESQRSTSGHDETSPEPALPELQGAFGPYELERSLGHGGQGVVYLADDTRLGRKVALKLLSASGSAGATAKARFEREATAASRLHHPGICTVYEAGELDGQRFLAMEYVDGESLSQWIARTTNENAPTQTGTESDARRARVDHAFRLVEQIARAVHTAHAAGVVHRDLKPQNIMLRRDGSPVVLDFGLARDDSDDGDTLTMQGDVLGTPAYMPPERVRGTAGQAADPREDVYGLGAILYECLTGKRPFLGHTREQLYQRILTSQVEDPRAADRAIPREARFVVETAMEKAPDRRYATALEFADELQRLQQREPILARPVPRWLRLQRWVQRHPGAAIPTIVAFVVLLAGVVIALMLLRQVDTEARFTNVRALLSESSLQAERDPQCALLLAREASRQLGDDAPDEMQTAVRSQLVDVLARIQLVRRLEHRDAHTVGVGFSGDGQRIATVVRGAEGPAVRLWPVNGGSEPAASAPIRNEGNKEPDQLTGCAFDEAGTRVLLTPFGGVARILSMQDASLLHVLTPREKRRNGKPAWIQFHHTGMRQVPGTLSCFVPGADDLVLVGSQDGARLWRVTEGQVQGEELWHDRREDWRHRSGGVCQVAISADGSTCATGDHDGLLRVLRTAPFEVVGQSRAHQRAVHALVFDPSRPLLVNAGWDEDVAIWSTEQGTDPLAGDEPELTQVGTLDLDGRSAVFLQFAPAVENRPDVLVALDNDRGLHLYRSTNAPVYFEHYASLRGDSAVVSVSFSPDGSKFVTGTFGGDVRVFDRQGRQLEVLRGGDSAVHGSCWSPDGRNVVTTESYGSANLWRSIDPRFRVHHLQRAVFRMATAKQRLVATMHDGGIAVMDLTDETLLTVRAPNRWLGTSLALRADGGRLAVGLARPGVDLWDLSGSSPRLEPEAMDQRWKRLKNDALDFRDDGTLIVADNRQLRAVRPNGDVERLADLNGGAIVATTRRGVVVVGSEAAMWDCEPLETDHQNILQGESQDIPARRAVSADGRWLALMQGTAGDAVRIVDVVERRLHRQFVEPRVSGVALSSDGARLLTTTTGGLTRLWDLAVEPPRQIIELRGHRGIVWDAAFHPNGEQLITAGSDGTIRFWPAHFDDLEDIAKEREKRDWTDAEKSRYGAMIGR